MPVTTAAPQPCHQPALFQERGLAVPFTTPLLAAARLRGSVQNGRPILELLVPNPSGAAGLYVLAWSDRAALGSCTVHDIYLGAAIETAFAQERALSPGTIRRVARVVGCNGHAGRSAAAACAAAAAAAAGRHNAATRELTLALVRQMEGPGASPPEADPVETLAWRARRCLDRLASQSSETAASLANAAESLAAPFAELGLGAAAPSAPLPVLLGQIAQTIHETSEWAMIHQNLHGASQSDPARLLATSGELVGTLAARAAGLARRRAADLPQLLRDCAANPAAVLSETTRAEWLLDGWERICLLWRAATLPRERALHLPEMARLMPALPAEMEAWFGLPAGTAARTYRRFHGSPQEAASALHADRIARNEHLRALAA